MYHYILFTLSFIMIQFSELTAQDAPNIPMKNGMVYCVFENKMQNTKKCLAKYCTFAEFNMKLTPKLGTIIKGNPALGTFYVMEIGTSGGKGQCNDTIAGLFTTTIPVKLRPSTLHDLSKKKIFEQSLECKIEIVFKGLNEYSLKLKGFQYRAASTKNGELIIDEYPLGTLYQDFLNNSNKTKEQIKFYQDLDVILNGLNKIVFESLKELYEVDELD